MASDMRIVDLAAIIKEKTELIHEYLTANNLPCPSFEVHGPAQLDIPADAPHIHEARQSVLEATEQLHDLIKGPRELLRVQWTEHVGMHFIVRHDIAKSFPTDGETTFSQIAANTGFDEGKVRRLIRHGIAHSHLFHEPRKDVIVHTALTRLLAEDDSVRMNLLNHLDSLWPPSTQVVHAVEKWPHSEEPQQTAFALANNTDKSMWDFYKENPERGEVFGRAMGAGDSIDGGEMKLVIDALPWEDLGEITVVDVGGSHGSVMINLARAFPKLRCVVQDLPEVAKEGESKLPADVAGRVSFQGHDFFTEQPISAEVYYLRSIMHNWSDKYCRKILQSLAPAVKPGARLHEFILPEAGTLSRTDEKRIRQMDVGMLQLLDSHQRSPDEFEELFRTSDSRFQLLKMTDNPGGAQAVMEVLCSSAS